MKLLIRFLDYGTWYSWNHRVLFSDQLGHFSARLVMGGEDMRKMIIAVCVTGICLLTATATYAQPIPFVRPLTEISEPVDVSRTAPPKSISVQMFPGEFETVVIAAPHLRHRIEWEAETVWEGGRGHLVFSHIYLSA